MYEIFYKGIKLKLNKELYAPSEDTDLIVSCVKKWFEKVFIYQTSYKKSLRILDMGCGPGTLGLYFLEELKKRHKKIYENSHLLALDRSEKALSFTKQNAILNQLQQHTTTEKTVLFKNLHSKWMEKESLGGVARKNSLKFDIILFNPPYLPGNEALINENSRNISDAIWEGGKEGDELTIQFIENLSKYCKEKADVFLVSSSRTRQDRIRKSFEKNGFKMVELSKSHVFFEDILCYRMKFKGEND